MSAFEQQLDEENEKRGLEQADDQAPAPEEVKPPALKKFSFKSFCIGLLLGALFLAGLVGWAWFQSETTLETAQSSLPSKTAIVKTVSSIEQAGSAQPVLTMQPIVNNDPAKFTPAEQTSNTAAVENKPSAKIENLDRNKNGLVPAPIPDLYESTSAGLLPIIRKSDGLKPFDAYKRNFKHQEGKIKLSVVITDIGISQNATKQIIKDFSPDVTLAFSSYALSLKTQVDQAREEGHETWLVLPMETTKYPLDDPGPSSILLNASVVQNKQRLNSVLASANGYVGLVAQKNHAFRSEDSMTNPSISDIFERGLAIVDSNTSVSSFVSGIATKNDYPHAKNTIWLDDDLTPLALNKRIRQLIEYGQINDRAILMLNAYPASLKALKKFLNSSAASDFQLAPLSSQVTYGG